ncbi:MAG: SagB/ThcOx family dehydrogenase [Candidatus Omnitrophota bacterium]
MKTSFVFLVALLLISGISEAADVVKLPQPKHEGKVSVEEAIFGRTSVRSFTGDPLTLQDVSQLLWSAGGTTVDGVSGPTRAYPSAGATYPLEIYLVAGNVKGLEAGVYRYNWRENSITLIKKGDFRNELTRAAMGQGMVRQAPVTIVITALFERTTRRYGDRGFQRYVSMDAGHLGQNVHLQAQGMGLGTVMIGAFVDREVAKVIGAGKDIPVYMMPVGRPR